MRKGQKAGEEGREYCVGGPGLQFQRVILEQGFEEGEEIGQVLGEKWSGSRERQGPRS